MCNTFKKNKTNEDITRNCYPIDEVNFPNTLLNNVDQLFLLQENIGLCNIKHIPYQFSIGQYDQSLIDKLKGVLKCDFELKPVSGKNYNGMSCIIRDKYNCPVTPGVTHQSNNGFLFTSNMGSSSQIRFKCHSE